MNDIITVAEKLYKEKNPDSKMDVPSFAYETVEKWNKEYLNSNVDTTKISLYEWIKINKTIK